jgi:hypothetical protein
VGWMLGGDEAVLGPVLPQARIGFQQRMPLSGVEPWMTATRPSTHCSFQQRMPLSGVEPRQLLPRNPPVLRGFNSECRLAAWSGQLAEGLPLVEETVSTANAA